MEPDSEHCNLCKNCIVGYDHHSTLLNKCIGSRNYRIFIGFLLLTVLYSGWFLFVWIYLLAISVTALNHRPTLLFQSSAW